MRSIYIYLTIGEFTDPDQNPITLSWFKWGVSTLEGPGGTTLSRTLTTDLPEASGLFDADIGEIEAFIREGDHGLPIEDWWEEEFLTFLEEFYTHHAPERYRAIYLTNIRLLKLMDDIEGAIHFGRDPAREATYEDVCNATSDLKKEVLSETNLEENYDYLREFTQLFEDVVLMLVDLEPQDLEKGHQTAFSELEDLYRDNVWLMIAHSISLESARGPNIDHIYSWSRSNLEELRAGYEDSLETKKEICDSVDLLPGMDDYPELNREGDFAGKFDEFMTVVDGRTSDE
jgi:hypothetical protein